MSISDIKVVGHDISRTIYSVTFNFDLVGIVANNVSHIMTLLDVTISDSALNAFIESLNRKREDFATNGQYINYVNNVKSFYEKIGDVISFEQTRPDKYINIGAFNPLYDIDEEARDTIRRTLASIANEQANAASPPPKSAIKIVLPTKMKLQRATTSFSKGRSGQDSKKNTADSKTFNTERSIIDRNISAVNGISVFERVSQVKTISRKKDLQVLKHELESKNIPFSEIFRENRHENIRDRVYGNIDTQHTLRNPGPPILEVGNPDVNVENLETSFKLVNVQENNRQVVKNFIIKNAFITNNIFNIKCLACANVSRNPQQVLISNVNHVEKVNEFILNLPPPTVRAVYNGRDKVAINIFYDSDHDYVGNLIVVDGYKILRRRFNIDENFVQIGETKLNDETKQQLKQISSGERINNSKLISTTFTDEITIVVKTEYRIIPINYKNETNGVFTDFIVNVPPKQFKDTRRAVGANFIVSSLTLSEAQQNVIISIKNIPPLTQTIIIFKRNVSQNKLKFDALIRLQVKNIHDVITHSDSSVSRDKTYEYYAEFFDITDKNLGKTTSEIIAIGISKENNIKTTVDNVKISKDVSFVLNTVFNDSSDETGLLKKIKQAIVENKIDKSFEDVLKNNTFVNKLGTVAINKVTLFNISDNKVEYSKFVESKDFKETTVKLDRSKEYEYRVKAAVVNVNDIIEGIADPRKLRNQQDTKNKFNGIVTTITGSNILKNDEILELSLGTAQTTIPVPASKEPIRITSLRAKRNNKRVTITWTAENTSNLNFFHVERFFDALRSESLGTTTKTIFFDIIDDIMLNSSIRYRITPILLDGTSSESAGVTLQ